MACYKKAQTCFKVIVLETTASVYFVRKHERRLAKAEAAQLTNLLFVSSRLFVSNRCFSSRRLEDEIVVSESSFESFIMTTVRM